MSDSTGAARHPFLEDLADDVVMTSNVTNKKVVGKENVLRMVGAATKIYLNQSPTYFNKTVDGRTLMEYDADIVGGRKVHGTIVLDWNPNGSVSHLSLGFTPLGAALSFAIQLGQLLSEEDSEKFGTI